MKPPFFGDDAGDVSVYLTLEEAEKDMEPPDVDRDDCFVYDSEGRRLHAYVDSGFLRERVRLREPGAEEPAHADALRNRLVTFLGDIGEPLDRLERQSLKELVATAVDRLRPRKP